MRSIGLQITLPIKLRTFDGNIKRYQKKDSQRKKYPDNYEDDEDGLCLEAEKGTGRPGENTGVRTKNRRIDCPGHNRGAERRKSAACRT